MRPIILIGMRGSGKTTVGNLLHERLHIPIIHMDKEIEKQEGKSIPKITSEHGWDYFRTLEREYIKHLTVKPCILSTGGGVVIQQENREHLKNIGIVFYLYAKPETLYKRIGNDTSRPLLKEHSMLTDLKTIFKERKKWYEDTAHYSIHTESLTPNEVVETIYQYLKLDNNL